MITLVLAARGDDRDCEQVELADDESKLGATQVRIHTLTFRPMFVKDQ